MNKIIIMDASKLSKEEKKALFAQLYEEFDGSEEEVETSLKESNIVKKEAGEAATPKKRGPKPGVTRKPVDVKTNRYIAEGLPKVLFAEYSDGMKQAELAEKHKISKYMVAKLLKIERESRSNGNVEIDNAEEVSVNA